MSSKFTLPHSSVMMIALLAAGFVLNLTPAYPQNAVGAVTSSSSGASASGASSTASTATTSVTAKIIKADEKFFMQLAQANLIEINSAKLVEEKSKNEQVKALAKKMLEDHTKALDELKQLAQAKGITLPTEPDRQQKLMENRLASLSGEKFDKQYVQNVSERIHKDEHKLLLQAGSKAQDSDLKNYAIKNLSVVESHQQLVKETSRSMESGAHGKSGTGASSGGSMSEKTAPAYGQ
jgi:putative membrane protein